MSIVYKFTDSNCITYNNTVWIPGEWKETNGEGSLCGPGWLHAYSHPLIAVLHDPIYGNFLGNNGLLWRTEASGKFLDNNGMKCGYSRMRLIEQIPIPTVTIEQRVKYAILCAKAVYTEPSFISWADNWLNNIDRSEKAALVAARTAEGAAVGATRAAVAAAEAAQAAVDATRTVGIATWAIEWAALVAARTAEGAARATALTAAMTAAKATVSSKLDLISLAERATQ